MYKLILILVLIGSYGNSASTSSSFANQILIENVSFVKLGTYRGFAPDGSEYQKSYFYPKYSLTAPFLESRAICKSYDFELATLETHAEAQAIIKLAQNLGSEYFYVDAIALTLKSPTDWYWTKSGKKLSFALPWGAGEPNNYNNLNETCLALSSIGFVDLRCTLSRLFVCQKIEFMIPNVL
ncbi:unnamed protein product [Chironomus riparius]|uniref:C-type lectin domain-containing protein n=1 Tax=Chironomus riparius TaxID=315576 RepID=A0A9N9RX81_9DIPT|nr:unnamed protein product [Chironomus riparius]